MPEMNTLTEPAASPIATAATPGRLMIFAVG